MIICQFLNLVVGHGHRSSVIIDDRRHDCSSVVISGDHYDYCDYDEYDDYL